MKRGIRKNKYTVAASASMFFYIEYHHIVPASFALSVSTKFFLEGEGVSLVCVMWRGVYTSI
jgi:hypothetical protein